MTSGQRRGKLLIVTPSAYTLSGLATWLDYLEPGLTALGWSVTVGLIEGPRHHLPARYLAEHPHPRWRAIPCMTTTPAGRQRAIAQAIAAVAPDIIATVNVPDAVLGAARVRQRSPTALKIAMTVHGIQPDLYDDLRALGPWLDRVYGTNRLACRLAAVRGGIAEARITYAPYGVAYGGPAPPQPRDDRLLIAFVGRLEQDQKQIFDLPEILAALDLLQVPYQLLIAGTGPDEAALRARLASRPPRGEVAFLGFLTPPQLQEQVLDQADVLLMTSSWETGPLVIWEAMARGVAVVSSQYLGSGLESALSDEVNALLYPVGEPQQAASQVRRLWNDAGLRERLIAGGHRLVESRYSIPVSVANWDQQLRDLLMQPPLPAGQTIAPLRASGRLDRLLGAGLAETLRARLGRIGPDGGPGGEWPHSHGTTDYWDPDFWALAKELDIPEAGPTPV